MCNACGFLCCASDQMDACGCDHCNFPECWSICDVCGETGDNCDCDYADDEPDEHDDEAG